MYVVNILNNMAILAQSNNLQTILFYKNNLPKNYRVKIIKEIQNKKKKE